MTNARFFSCITRKYGKTQVKLSVLTSNGCRQRIFTFACGAGSSSSISRSQIAIPIKPNQIEWILVYIGYLRDRRYDTLSLGLESTPSSRIKHSQIRERRCLITLWTSWLNFMRGSPFRFTNCPTDKKNATDVIEHTL